MPAPALRTEIAKFPPERVGTLDDLQHWPRLRQTLYEALRLYPPAPHMNREAIADDTVLGERVEAGAQVWISPWVIHRHRKFWDQPTAFMPDRFAGKALGYQQLLAVLDERGELRGNLDDLANAVELTVSRAPGVAPVTEYTVAFLTAELTSKRRKRTIDTPRRTAKSMFAGMPSG